MNKLIKYLESFFTIIIFGVLLVQFKRNSRFLFWPLFVFCHLIISIIITVLIGLFIDVFIGQFILGTYLNFINSSAMYPIIILIFILFGPILYSTIGQIEVAILDSKTNISNFGIISGYLWGLVANLFVLHRLGILNALTNI